MCKAVHVFYSGFKWLKQKERQLVITLTNQNKNRWFITHCKQVWENEHNSSCSWLVEKWNLCRYWLEHVLPGLHQLQRSENNDTKTICKHHYSYSNLIAKNGLNFKELFLYNIQGKHIQIIDIYNHMYLPLQKGYAYELLIWIHELQCLTTTTTYALSPYIIKLTLHNIILWYKNEWTIYWCKMNNNIESEKKEEGEFDRNCCHGVCRYIYIIYLATK